MPGALAIKGGRAPWKPLITVWEAKEIVLKISGIAAQLEKNLPEIENIGLFSGRTGICLFFFYLAKWTGRKAYADLAHELLGDVFDRVSGGKMSCTLANGLAGIGWAVEHLARNNFIEADTDQLLKDADGILHESMLKYLGQGDYDVLHGALSQGMYFLDRRVTPRTEILMELVKGLDAISIKESDGSIKWRSVLEPGKGKASFDPGLSHGSAGIVYFLARMLPVLKTENDRQTVSRLLDGAVRYLLRVRLEPGTSISHFPTWISDDGPLKDSRLAWCYGDLGIGAALLWAGRITRNKEWEQTALYILRRTTHRRELFENFVADAGFCHGTAGNAHIYHRLYRYTGIHRFKESALYWFSESMKMAVHEDGYAGFKAFTGGNTRQALPGLLEGAAGIGLVFLAAVSAVEPRWDRCLMLS